MIDLPGSDRDGAPIRAAATGVRQNGRVGRILIAVGLVLVAAGVLLVVGERLPFRLGRLPGDIVVHGERTTFYFPIVTCLILSVLLSLALWLVRRR